MKSGRKAPNAIDWPAESIRFLKKNFHTKTNQQLADHLGLKLTSVRTKCYELGLKRMELEYWTDEQVAFLINNYQVMGDVEIAELFDYLCPKDKGWSNKHIEKKRLYLNIKRTPQEIQAIKARNIEIGCYAECNRKMWATRGVSPEGTIKHWRPSYETERKFPVIKVNGAYVRWAPFTWERLHGPVPKGMNVIFKDNDPYNLDPNNLAIVTDGELSKRNAIVSILGLSDNYVAGILTHRQLELRELVKQQPQLIELKRQQLILNRTIYEQQKLSSEA